MARVRSPNYPAISLPEAIDRIGKVFDKENRHSAPRGVMVKALGFGGENGTSMSALSAVVKYGLLDKQGESYRVSDRAMSILHPHTPAEKAEAIKAAAEAPTLFSELLNQFPGGLPSDDNLRAYLIRSGFAPSALPGVIQSLRDTLSLVGGGVSQYNIDDPPAAKAEGRQSMQPATINPPVRRAPHPGGEGANEPFTISISAGGIRGSFDISDGKTLSEMIRYLTGLGLLLRNSDDIKTPSEGQHSDISDDTE